MAQNSAVATLNIRVAHFVQTVIRKNLEIQLCRSTEMKWVVLVILNPVLLIFLIFGNKFIANFSLALSELLFQVMSSADSLNLKTLIWTMCCFPFQIWAHYFSIVIFDNRKPQLPLATNTKGTVKVHAILTHTYVW